MSEGSFVTKIIKQWKISQPFPQGSQKRGNPTLTTSTVTARRKEKHMYKTYINKCINECIRRAFGPRRVRVRLAMFDLLFFEFFDIFPWPGGIEPPMTPGDGGPERFCWPLDAPGLIFGDL